MTRLHNLLSALFVVMATLVVCSSCKNDVNNPQPEPPSMTILDAPNALLANADTCYLYRVKLENVEADSVMVSVESPNQQPHSTFALYDDGGQGLTLFPAYVCFASGDIVPNDHIYSRQINGQDLANGTTGDYQFTFHAPSVSDEVRDVTVQNVEPCLITSYPLTQTFETCFAPMTLEVRVARTEGDVVDRVLGVIGSSQEGDIDTLHFTALQGDTVWQTQITPHFFECLNGPYYGIRYEAHTRYGMICYQIVAYISYASSLPVLSNSTLPDTIYRPTSPSELDTIITTVHFQDCELAGEQNYYGVRFNVRREDQQAPAESDSFFYRDDGVAPDLIPGNGTYTVGLTFGRNDEHPNAMYYFGIYAIECAAPFDTSEVLMDSVRLIQPPGSLSDDIRQVILPGRDFGVVH